MAKKKTTTKKEYHDNFIQEQRITDTLELNYMPYAMSVIISRAIPEIDGFKPSHRKLLYTMYLMGLLKGDRTKSANVVGQTMKLNPHGDSAIYETMVRLTKDNEALLVPFVDSEGNFGKYYSREMAYAASRYTEVKLESICQEIFADIDKDTVSFIDNYDGSMKEPALLPTTFPNILANPNLGIAVGMASSICSFNLAELCEATAQYIKDDTVDLCEVLSAPDFSTGGELIYSRKDLEQIYKTGRGSVKLRAKYRYDKKDNCIEVYEIPYTTNIEAIVDKIIALVKAGKIKDITDVRDESDRNGLKITIDLKRGTNVELLMHKLFAMTPLSDSFSCNFNVLIHGKPMTLGVGEILKHWTDFRMDSIRRQLAFDIQKQALESTRALLKSEGMEQKARLILDSHENMAKYADEASVDGICFNFGYLPGSDHSLATKPESSKNAVIEGLRLLKKGGVMSLCIYSGGETGFEERDTLLAYLKSLDEKKYLVIVSAYYNRKNNPPIPVLIIKK